MGQWAITPGIIETPHAVGIISTTPRRIRHPRAYIGIQFNRAGTDAIIDYVMPGLGAEKAGLRSGDRILTVNGSTITNASQVVQMLGEFREGQKPKLRLRRDDKEFDVEIPMKVPAPGQLAFGSSPDRAARMNGSISSRAEGFESVIQHDTALLPWLCGGPLVNLDGEGIGLNIARAGRVATYALPVPVLKKVIAELTGRIPTSAPRQRSGS
jgi:serine protease Do